MPKDAARVCMQDKNVSLTAANTQLDAKLHEAQAAYSRAQLTQARWASGMCECMRRMLGRAGGCMRQLSWPSVNTQ